jgi:prohibitin 1
LDKEFIRFHAMAPPRELGREALEAFLTHLAVDKRVAASTQNQAFSALIFLYREVYRLNTDWHLHAPSYLFTNLRWGKNNNIHVDLARSPLPVIFPPPIPSSAKVERRVLRRKIMMMGKPGLSLPASVVLFLVSVIAIAGLNGFVVINPGEAAVLSVLGKAQDGTLLEGIHFKPPFVSRLDVYDLTVQKFEVPAQSSTKDLQQLSASFAINFRLDPTQIVNIRRTQGTLQNIVAKIVAPQTQESFKIAAARRTVEEAITKRDELKQDFDTVLNDRLSKYGIIVLDTSVVDLNFSEEFSRAVEEKQIADQRAQRAVYVAQEAAQEAEANVNRAKGQAEAQRLLRETLTPELLQKQAIEKWDGKFPLVMGGSGALPLLNLEPEKLATAK